MNIIEFNNQAVTKQSIKDTCDNIVNAVSNGELDALSAQIRIKHLEEVVKDLKKRLFEYSDNQFDRDAENKKVVKDNAEISRVDRLASLDYESDEEYSRLNKELKDRKMLLDDAFKMAEKGHELVIDGEIIPVVNRKSGGSTYFKVTLK